MIPPIRFYCERVVPFVYDPSFTVYEILCKLINYLNNVINNVNENSDNIEALTALVNSLQNQLYALEQGGWLEANREQFIAWIEKNLASVLDPYIRQVFFGLTLDGYFVAYIPDSWADITFDTVANYSNEYYGRLVLKYYVDGELNVIQPAVS